MLSHMAFDEMHLFKSVNSFVPSHQRFILKNVNTQLVGGHTYRSGICYNELSRG